MHNPPGTYAWLQEAEDLIRQHEDETAKQHEASQELARVKKFSHERKAHLDILEKEVTPHAIHISLRTYTRGAVLAAILLGQASV